MRHWIYFFIIFSVSHSVQSSTGFYEDYDFQKIEDQPGKYRVHYLEDPTKNSLDSKVMIRDEHECHLHFWLEHVHHLAAARTGKKEEDYKYIDSEGLEKSFIIHHELRADNMYHRIDSKYRNKEKVTIVLDEKEKTESCTPLSTPKKSVVTPLTLSPIKEYDRSYKFLPIEDIAALSAKIKKLKSKKHPGHLETLWKLLLNEIDHQHMDVLKLTQEQGEEAELIDHLIKKSPPQTLINEMQICRKHVLAFFKYALFADSYFNKGMDVNALIYLLKALQLKHLHKQETEWLKSYIKKRTTHLTPEDLPTLKDLRTILEIKD
ncbi:hypothetical protein [Candidatus Nucleicultrix amoebiphila]|jgi:hypothetical protein|uniref:Uncharacterized protein n=1 Tax=Candidatus Nucleicultrix amoebiphila FS5 TaxID=1414854 RepID=A0A1W6N336_9PROT|nr:hypothetical protein [Candidatus Nucleicultrix amoebiphila]ARN84218.1 hypothetical protein GQ61_01415 [Candidatus Nucleicultrix amoebiphila FS5]